MDRFSGHTVQLKDEQCKVFYDKLTFIYIELPKFDKAIDALASHQDQWLYLLRHLPELDNRPAPFQDPVFLELFDIAEIANFSRNEQETYEQSLKYYRDLNNVVSTSWQEGKAEGLAEGIERGERSLLVRLLQQKLGTIPDPLMQQLNALSGERWQSLGECIFELNSIAALEQWLMRSPSLPRPQKE